MERIRRLIVEIHRRSLWQVLAVYVGASWFVLQAAEHVVQRYLLPEWVYPAAVILLLIGLPIVLATAMVREEPVRGTTPPPSITPPLGPVTVTAAAPAPEPESASRDSPPRQGAPTVAAALRSSPVGWLLTWRRALVGGVLAFVALGMAVAFIVHRGTPRVAEAHGSAGDAFAERGWVVVADFDAADEDRVVALAAREALTVDLQQSGFVQVYPRAQIGGVLRRIGVPDTVRLDLELALEVAQRVGAGAVLGATVSRLGPQYVLSARALHPESREELFAVRAAAGQERLLEGVETLSREVRRRFGERREEVRRSRPLPEVTTSSLDALRLYAEAADLLSRGGAYDRVGALAAQAVRIDSTFAMGHRLAGVVAFNQLRMEESRRHLEMAFALRDRLTERERWHVEAQYYDRRLEPRRAAGTYEVLLARYPDDASAANNLGVIHVLWLGRFATAYELFARASSLDPFSALSLSNALFVGAYVGEFAAADSLARVAEERGFDWLPVRWRAGRAFATGDHPTASAICDTILSGPTRFLTLTDDREFCGSIEVARGRIGVGLEYLGEAERAYAGTDRHVKFSDAVLAAAAADIVRGAPLEAGERLTRLVEQVNPEALPEPDRFLMRTNLEVMAALLERPDIAERVAAAYPPYPEAEHWLARAGEALAGAARAIAAGDHDTALVALRAYQAGEHRPSHFLFAEFFLPALAHDRAGRTDEAIASYHELSAERRLAPPFTVMLRIKLPFVLRRLAELEASRGNMEASADHYRRLLDLWSDADPEVQDQVDSVRRALASIAFHLTEQADPGIASEVVLRVLHPWQDVERSPST